MTPGKTSSTQELCGFTRGASVPRVIQDTGPFWTEQARRPNLESGHQSLDLGEKPLFETPLVKKAKK